MQVECPYKAKKAKSSENFATLLYCLKNSTIIAISMLRFLI